MYENDPLWKLRHALLGVGLATLLSVPVAAVLGSALGDTIGGTYEWRAGLYSALVLYVIAGAVVLFAKVARHETRPVSARRVGLWLVSLWLWPALLLARRGAGDRGPGAGSGGGPGSGPGPSSGP
jgi:predicted MFS family arabinose efflux permease